MQRIIKTVILAVVLAALISTGIAGTFLKDTQEFYRNGTHAGTQADSHPGTVRMGTGNHSDRSLVGFWRFDSTDDPFPGSSFNVTDYSGRGNNGSSFGGVTHDVDGIRGSSAYEFDGTDDYIEIGETSLGTTYTVSAWFKEDSLSSGGFETLLHRGDSAACDYEPHIRVNGTHIQPAVSGCSGSGRFADVPYQQGTWNHVAITVDRSSQAVYLNGVEQATGDITPNSITDQMLVGNRRHTSQDVTDFFPGSIDNARVYDRALADQEIQHLYNRSPAYFNTPFFTGNDRNTIQWGALSWNETLEQGTDLEARVHTADRYDVTDEDNAVPYVAKDNLVGYWDLEQTSGDVWDRSGNGNNGMTGGDVNRTADGFDTGSNAFGFAGVDDHLNVSDDASLDGMEEITLSAWIKPRSFGENVRFLRKGGAYTMRIGPSGNVYYDVRGNDWTWYDSGYTMSAGRWHHLLLMYNGTHQVLYGNGERQDMTAETGDIVDSNTPLQLATASHPVNGTMDEIRIWNTSLTAEDVRTLVNPDAYSWSENGQWRDGDWYSDTQHGLVGYWPLESTKGNVTDWSGEGNDGTAHNGLVTREGGVVPQSNAYRFDGTDDNVTIPADSSLYGMTDLTLSAWVKPRQLGELQAIIAADHLYELVLDDGTTCGTGEDVFWALRNGEDWANNCEPIDVPTGQWTHLALVSDTAADEVRIYKNGELQVTDAGTGEIESNSNNVGLGQRGTSALSGPLFDGIIDEARIYDRALSQSEVRSIMTPLTYTSRWMQGPFNWVNWEQQGGMDGDVEVSVRKMLGVPEGDSLIGRWSFEGRGQTLVDSIGENHGVLGGNSDALSDDPSRNNGYSGQGLDLHGSSSDRAQIDYGTTMNDTLNDEVWTMSFFFKPVDPVNASNWLDYVKIFAEESGAFRIEQNGGTEHTLSTFWSEDAGDPGNNPATNLCDFTGLSDTRWYHLALTLDKNGDGSRCYVDGAETDATSSGNLPAFDDVIGPLELTAETGKRWFADEFQLFDRALSQDEIHGLANITDFAPDVASAWTERSSFDWTAGNQPDIHVESMTSRLAQDEPSYTDVDLGVANDGLGPWDVNVTLWNYSVGALSWDEAVMGSNSNLVLATVGGDIDGDGDTDMAAADSDGIVQFYENTGGSWSTSTIYNQSDVTNDNIQSISLGDINGDGDLDLVAGGNNHNVTVRENTAGDGSSWSTAAQETLNDRVWTVSTGDVDGDGSVDIVAGTSDSDGGTPELVFLDNTAGDGTSWAETEIDTRPDTQHDYYTASLADIDGDGDLDVVVGGSGAVGDTDIEYWENTAGDGTSWAGTVIKDDAEYYQNSLVTGDVDRDGDLDVVYAHGHTSNTGVINWLENEGGSWTTRSIGSQASGVKAVDLGDLDLDGDLDVVATGGEGDIILYENDGSGGGWSTDTITTAADTRWDLEVVDIDGGGDLDVVAGGPLDVNLYRYRTDGIATHLLNATQVTFPGAAPRYETARIRWTPRADAYDLMALVDPSRNYTAVFESNDDGGALNNRLLQHVDPSGSLPFTDVLSDEEGGYVDTGEAFDGYYQFKLRSTGDVDNVPRVESVSMANASGWTRWMGNSTRSTAIGADTMADSLMGYWPLEERELAVPTPVGIAEVQTNNGAHELVSEQARNVDNTGMDVRSCEMDVGDGCDAHADEEIGWFVTESGDVTVDGTTIGQAGTFTTSDGDWQVVDFNQAYAEPVVVGTSNTKNGGQNALIFEANVSSASAHVRLCETEGNETDGCDAHTAETGGYLIIDAADVDDIDGLEASTFEQGGGSDDGLDRTTVSYAESFAHAPIVLGSVQTVNGSSPTEVRVTHRRGNEFVAGICHQDGIDVCDSDHVAESVGWIAVEPGNVPFDQPSAAGSTGTLAPFAGDWLTTRYQPVVDAADPSTSTADILGYGIGDVTVGEPGVFDANAYRFNGTEEGYLVVPDRTDSERLDITDALTMAAWVKLDNATASDDHYIISKSNFGANGYGFNIRDTGRVEADVNTGNSQAHWDTDAFISTDDWAHVAVTYNGSQITVYVNGTRRDTLDRTGTIRVNTNDVTLGTASGNTGVGTNMLDGWIDEPRIYNRSLTADEISQLYQYPPGAPFDQHRPHGQVQYRFTSTAPENTSILGSLNTFCGPPETGDWIIREDCTFTGTDDLNGDVDMRQDATLTMDDDSWLQADLSSQSIDFEQGAKILFDVGAKIW